MECTKDRQYFLIETCRRNNMNATEIFNFIESAWPGECFSLVHIRKICREFSEGIRLTSDRHPGSGRRKSDERIDNKINVENMINENKSITVQQIADTLQISHTMVQRILEEDLNVLWIHTQWVPHRLTEGNKAVRVERCVDLVQTLPTRQCKANLVTIDEKFFLLQEDAAS